MVQGWVVHTNTETFSRPAEVHKPYTQVKRFNQPIRGEIFNKALNYRYVCVSVLPASEVILGGSVIRGNVA